MLIKTALFTALLAVGLSRKACWLARQNRPPRNAAWESVIRLEATAATLVTISGCCVGAAAVVWGLLRFI